MPYSRQNKVKTGESLLRWEKEFNEQVLNKRGVTVKVRARGMRSNGQQQQQGYTVTHALAFAFTPEGVSTLEAEPRNTGDTNSCCGCSCSENGDMPIMMS